MGKNSKLVKYVKTNTILYKTNKPALNSNIDFIIFFPLPHGHGLFLPIFYEIKSFSDKNPNSYSNHFLI